MRSGSYRGGGATSDENLKHLEEYVRKIKDTKFRQRLIAAVKEFYAHKDQDRDLMNYQGTSAYETDVLAVHRVPHFAEIRYGFHFKDTNEFGLYGFFVADSNKIYKGYYRTDSKFEAENYLHDLGIDEQI